MRVHRSLARVLAGQSAGRAELEAILSSLTTVLRRVGTEPKSTPCMLHDTAHWYSAAVRSMRAVAPGPPVDASGPRSAFARAAVVPLLGAQLLALGARAEALGSTCSGLVEALPSPSLALAAAALSADSLSLDQGRQPSSASTPDDVRRSAAGVGCELGPASAGVGPPAHLMALLRLAGRCFRDGTEAAGGEEAAALAGAARLARAVAAREARAAAALLGGGKGRRRSRSPGAGDKDAAGKAAAPVAHALSRAVVAAWRGALGATRIDGAAVAEDLEAAVSALGRVGAAESEALSGAIAAARTGGGAGLWDVLGWPADGGAARLSDETAARLFAALAGQAADGGGPDGGAEAGEDDGPLFVIDKAGADVFAAEPAAGADDGSGSDSDGDE